MRKALALGAGLFWLAASQAGVAMAHTAVAQDFVMQSRDGEVTRVVMTGVVNATGTVADNVVVDPYTGTFTNHAVMTFPDGTMTFDDGGSAFFDFDPKSCTAKGGFVAPFTISSGTGAYAGATGSGTVSGDLKVIFGHTADGCSPFPAKSWGQAHAKGDLAFLP